MAKSAEEINELLATDLYRRAIKEKLIAVNDDHTVIQYNCFNKTKRRLQNPEEFVQSEAFLKLVYDYDYLPENISINEAVQIGSETREADILVMIIRNHPIGFYCRCDAQNPMCRRRKLS